MVRDRVRVRGGLGLRLGNGKRQNGKRRSGQSPLWKYLFGFTILSASRHLELLVRCA